MADTIPHDVFISHENHDSDLALEIAARLHAVGYTSWCYENNSSAGGSYLVQVDRAIEMAKAVVVIVSEHSVRSPHVRNEVIRAYESRKRFIPVRRHLAHEVMLTALDDADDERRREWRMAFGASVSLAWDHQKPAETMASMERGLRTFGIEPSLNAADRPTGPAGPAGPAGLAGLAGLAQAFLRSPRQPLHDARSTTVQRIVLAVVALLGIVMCMKTIVTAFVDPVQEHFYQLFPAAQYLNVLANIAGLGVFGYMAYLLLQFFQGRQLSVTRIRALAEAELLVIISWTIGSLVVALSAPANYARLRTDYVISIVIAAVFGAAPVVLLRWLFLPGTPQNPE